ncbi:MAG TPA: hypothetical protein VFU05_03710 [Cyclobacteriaceae bacterium]|nr:hypothetical protein [Cyclobacteriaceae bacterium]
MTKRLSLIALLFISLFSGCKDDMSAYECDACTNNPEANPAYDNTGQGIYKGVLIGSSGNIKVNMANDGTTISAVIVIDGASVTLTGNGTYSTSSGFQGSFTGSFNGGTIIIPFSVSNIGVVSVGSPTIPGHSNVIFSVLKERSTQLVEAYEGTFRGADSGTFNMLILRDNQGNGVWYAIARSDADFYLQGDIMSNDLTGGGGELLVTGEIGGDNVSGAWQNTSVEAVSGTWKGKRTL